MPAPHSKTAEAILREVRRFQEQFVECHYFLANNTHRLAELLCEAESRGVLLDEAFSLASISYWLQHIDWQSRFLKEDAQAPVPTHSTTRPAASCWPCCGRRVANCPATPIRPTNCP